MEDIRHRPGVEEVLPADPLGNVLALPAGDHGEDIEGTAKGLAGAFWALPRFPWSQPPIHIAMSGHETEETLAPDQIILPDRALGTDLQALIGSTLELEYIVATGPGTGEPAVLELTVAGLYDSNSPSGDGPSAVYVAEQDYLKLLRASQGLPVDDDGVAIPLTTALIKSGSIEEASQLAQDLTAEGYFIESVGAGESVSRAVWTLTRVNAVLAGLLAVFGVGLGLGLAGTWAELRRWDVGILTSLGWTSRQVLASYAAEIAIVGIIHAAAAVLLGASLSLVIGLLFPGAELTGLTLAEDITLPGAGWVIGILGGFPLALLVGALPRLVRLSRLPPDLALRRP